MKITLLGTGTSQGIPVIGCDCPSCQSDDPRDDRLRSAVLIESEEVNILIDTSPDLRQQMLRHHVSHIDAILYTHEHNDHVIGLDDIRPFNFQQNKNMPLYGMKRVIDDIKCRFEYVFQEHAYPGAPRAEAHIIDEASDINIGGLDVIPIKVMHGNLPILGYRIGDFTFLTDVSQIDEESIEKVKGTKILVVNALRKERHHSHFSLSEAVDFVGLINPDRAYLTHVSHKMGPVLEWERELPPKVFPAFDGLKILM